MRPRAIALLLLSFAAACADPEPAAAAAAFARFQDAMLAGEVETCRGLLTEASAQALADLPWSTLRRRRPLQVLGADRGVAEFRVRVTDPNDGDRPGQFVVVREHGRLVVDLVASAGLTAEERLGAGAHDVLEPRELTPADLERIRQHQLATPPR